MNIIRSRRGFFSAMCGGFLAFIGLRPTARATAEGATVPANPVERHPIEFDPVTSTYVYDSQNRLVSMIEPADAGNVTVYNYG